MSEDIRPKATIVIEHHGAVICRRVYMIDVMTEEALHPAQLFGYLDTRIPPDLIGPSHKLTIEGDALIVPPPPRDPLIFGASA